MDFVYDKIQGGGVETPPPDAAGNSSLDDAAGKFEQGIEKAYETVSSKATWNSLWNRVKEQGAAVQKELNTMLADPSEGSTAAGAGAGAADPESTTAQPAEKTESEGPSTSSSTETLTSKANGSNEGSMMQELTKRAQGYIDNLDRDLERIESTAGSYLLKFGKDLRTVLKEAVSISGPDGSRGEIASDVDSDGEDGTSEILFNVPEDIRKQIYSTRLDAQLHALHTSKEPFLATIEEPGYKSFSESFKVNDHTTDIASDLETYPRLRELMESLVPAKVPYIEFWSKYYFMRAQISEQEKKRKDLLKHAEFSGQDGEIDWDDDEEEEAEEEVKSLRDSKTKDQKPASSRPSSESSYDLVSKDSSRTSLKREDNDEDDDWE